MDSQNIMNDLTIKSGKNTQIILNGNPVINGMALKPGINMLLFDKYMKKSVLWNYNHIDTNMTQRFLHIMNILPKNLYCIITIKGDINKVMNKFIKDYLKQKLNTQYLDNLVNFSAWGLLFYRDNDGYVNVRESHDVNQQVNMYLTIHSNPIATREEAIKQELENTLDDNQEDIEPVNTNIEMNIQKVKPIIETTEEPEPEIETTETTTEEAEPEIETTETTTEEAEPVIETTEEAEAEPVIESTETTTEEQEQEAVIESSETTTEEAEPVIESTETTTEEAEPVIETTETTTEEAEPEIESSETTTEEAEPEIESTETTSETTTEETEAPTSD